jgi:hypothetical protein
MLDKDNYGMYDKARRALWGKTIELAINFHMPKKTLLKEIERIIDEEQKTKLGGFVQQKLIKRQTAKQWARGLACWDLKKKTDITNYRLAKELAPLWRKDDMPAIDGEPAQDTDKKQVRDALKATEPMIHGGWRVLGGDPMATINTDHLEVIRKGSESL